MNDIEKIADLTPWLGVFETKEEARFLAWRIDQMMPRAAEIFTGKLSYTRSYFASIEDGTLHVLKHDPLLNLRAAFDVLRVLAAHHRVARVGTFEMVSPGFWIRQPIDKTGIIRGDRARPVMPLTHLSSVSGREPKALRFLLRPLIQDGALTILRNTDGTDGALLNDGFVCDARIQGLLRP